MTASVGQSRVRLALAGLISAIAALRLLVSIVPDTVYDIDPLTTGFTYAGIGPGLSVLLDGFLLLVAAVSLELERRRRGLDGWLLLLIALPLIPLAWHAWHDALDFWRGADWFAGATAAAALAHLGRSARCREFALAIILGAIVVTALRGGWQLFVEHPATVEHYQEHTDDVLAMHGWSKGSSAAEIYERRLMQAEATGWIGFSNITSGMYGAAAVAFVSLALLAGRSREQLGTVVGLMLLAVVMAVLITINGSKGAILATVLALGLFIGFVLPGAVGKRIRAIGGVVVLVVAFLAVCVVVVRGLLPEGFLGEKSMLFRWHYTTAGLRMLGDAPLLGVGPDGFQDAYGAVKSLRSPEMPASAHAAWLDWLVSLGPLGLAWVGAMVVLLLRKGEEEQEASQARVPMAWAAFFGLIIFMGALILQLFVESGILDQPGRLIRIVGVVLAMSTTLLVVDGFRHAPPGAARLVALLAAMVFAAQGQIEMLFWQSGSVVVAFSILGLAGTAATREPRSRQMGWSIGACVLGVVLLIAGVFLLLGEAQMRRSAEGLLAIARGTVPADSASIEEARWRAASMVSAGMVEDDRWWDRRRARAATSQFGMLANVEDRERAFVIAEGWVNNHPGAESTARRAALARGSYAMNPDPESLAMAIEMTWEAIPYLPQDPMLRVYLAELLLEANDPAGAAAQLDEAVRLNAELELDPLSQFNDEQRDRVSRARRRAQAAE